MKATLWRAGMKIGMQLHHLAAPSSPSPSFTIKIPSRISNKTGSFDLVFYVPQNYKASKSLLFPVVVNFHGGGFTLGTGTDDARWARCIVEHCKAVFVSVDYRLAPKYPFSVGVDDAADAVIYLAAHSDELRIDPHRMALTGFSAGANFALTAPLVLHDLQRGAGLRTLRHDPPPVSRENSSTSQSKTAPPATTGMLQINENAATADLPTEPIKETSLEINHGLPIFKLQAIVSFYPPTDFRIPRHEKRVTNPQPEKNLPQFLTDLFDESYISPERTTYKLNFSDPYLSPAAASDEQLIDAYPESIILYTCEYDMLNAEGVTFGQRLKDLGKSVKGGLIRKVPHAFDKKPNPLNFPQEAMRCYNEACAELNTAFGRKESFEDRRQLDLSKPVDRFEENDVIDVKEGAKTRS